MCANQWHNEISLSKVASSIAQARGEACMKLWVDGKVRGIGE